MDPEAEEVLRSRWVQGWQMGRSGDTDSLSYVCVGRKDIRKSHLAQGGSQRQWGRFLARLNSTRFCIE